MAFVDDITADLARRDFTVNAIALDPLDGKVVDPHGGRGDLKRKVLRAVGNAKERFSEDGLPVSSERPASVATLELALDPETEAAIRPTLDTYRKVARERVRDEWIKTMKARAPSRAFESDAHDGDSRGDVLRSSSRTRGHGAEPLARLRRLAPRARVHGRMRG